MPKLAAFVDSLDTVDEPYRPLYVQDGTRFKLDADGVEDVTGLKNALDAQKKLAKERADKLSEAERRLKEREESEAAQAAGISQATLDKIKADAAAERKPIEDERDALMQEVRELRLEGPAATKFLGAGMFPDEWELAKPRILKRLTLSDTKQPVVLDESGNPTAKSLDDLVAEWAQKHPRWFASDAGSGSGATRSGGGGGAPKPAAQAALERKRRDPATAIL